MVAIGVEALEAPFAPANQVRPINTELNAPNQLLAIERAQATALARGVDPTELPLQPFQAPADLQENQAAQSTEAREQNELQEAQRREEQREDEQRLERLEDERQQAQETRDFAAPPQDTVNEQALAAAQEQAQREEAAREADREEAARREALEEAQAERSEARREDVREDEQRTRARPFVGTSFAPLAFGGPAPQTSIFV